MSPEPVSSSFAKASKDTSSFAKAAPFAEVASATEAESKDTSSFVSRRQRFWQSRSFSLVEAAAFLAVLIFGFMAIFRLVTSYLNATRTAKERVVANLLAQEGIELILSKRNDNLIVAMTGGSQTWLQGFPPGDFCIDPTRLEPFSCNGQLVLEGGFRFTHGSGTTTPFNRKLSLSTNISSASSTVISSIVSWGQGGRVELKSLMTKWHPQAN